MTSSVAPLFPSGIPIRLGGARHRHVVTTASPQRAAAPNLIPALELFSAGVRMVSSLDLQQILCPTYFVSWPCWPRPPCRPFRPFTPNRCRRIRPSCASTHSSARSRPPIRRCEQPGSGPTRCGRSARRPRPGRSRRSGHYQPYSIVTARGPQRSLWQVQQPIPVPGTRRLRGEVADLRADVALPTRRPSPKTWRCG